MSFSFNLCNSYTQAPTTVGSPLKKKKQQEQHWDFQGYISLLSQVFRTLIHFRVINIMKTVRFSVCCVGPSASSQGGCDWLQTAAQLQNTIEYNERFFFYFLNLTMSEKLCAEKQKPKNPDNGHTEVVLTNKDG